MEESQDIQESKEAKGNRISWRMEDPQDLQENKEAEESLRPIEPDQHNPSDNL